MVFIDTTRRSYAIDLDILPSARGQGEPLTGKASTLPLRATVEHMLDEADDQKPLASDAGYGFICT